tara:strand:- start:340 stop:1116 length:777 start_codon:yes stop_codon:yes gene_type:complete
MNKNLNRRKIISINKKNIIYVFLILLIAIIVMFFYLYKNIIFYKFYNLTEKFSQIFQYELIYINANGLSKVSYDFIKSKIKKHIESSIFLLPLDNISKDLKENNWIKNLNLRTNYKDTIYIEIEEYLPIGLYNFNGRNFYFDKNGKIIEEIPNKLIDSEQLIIFSGQSSNKQAINLIKIMEINNFSKNFIIKKADYIQKRRWDVYLKNNIKLMLSERSPKESLINFMTIEKKISEIEMNDIKHFDLRNIEKTIITYNQ